MGDKVAPFLVMRRSIGDIVETPTTRNRRRIGRTVLVANLARFVEGLTTEKLIRTGRH